MGAALDRRLIGIAEYQERHTMRRSSGRRLRPVPCGGLLRRILARWEVPRQTQMYDEALDGALHERVLSRANDDRYRQYDDVLLQEKILNS